MTRWMGASTLPRSGQSVGGDERVQRISLKLGITIDAVVVVFLGGNTFQKRSVSSPAPVTRVRPSGLAAK